MPLQNSVDEAKKTRLQQQLLVLSFVNLLMVALLGVLMRAFPFLQNFPLNYKNILHGHSHFAFTGWVMLVLFVLLLKNFPALREKVADRHWRNIAILIVVSAFGMLVAFPLQGYKAVSISFSTLAIAATVYLAIVVTRALSACERTTSHRFVKWGLWYAAFSSLGPFALGPLMAMGKSGSTLYFDAIYFYLHFQYNGFFTFMVLALLYRKLEQKGFARHGKLVFFLLHTALLPAYALSVLWHQPPALFYWVGGAAAVLQLAGVFYLLKDIQKGRGATSFLLQLSLAALVIKSLLQVASAFPTVAQLAYEQRNFVIAYLHLVLLGFVTLFVFDAVLLRSKCTRWGLIFFLFSFFSTESLLVLQAAGGIFSFRIPFYPEIILGCSLFFPVGVAFLVKSFLVKQASPTNLSRHKKEMPGTLL
ncbi:hypothetical protein HRG84_14305 [Flavisolibacter sp. BT320]|nr:hypothetical protein [Flavisolibacter longurius]